MRHLGALLLLAFVFLASSSEAYRILCIFPFEGKSHFMMLGALCKGLAKKGHRVDVISHFPSSKPIANYSDIIDLSGTRRTIINNVSIEEGKHFGQYLTFAISQLGNDICRLMGIEKMQHFIKHPPNDPPYDVIIIEYFSSRCFAGFGPYLKAPVVVVVTNIEAIQISDFMGNPMSYAFVSGMSNPSPTVETFFDRVWNVLVNFKDLQLFYYYTAEQTDTVREYLSKDLPDVAELERGVSLALVNGHYSFQGIRPMTPGIVEVGGLHVEINDMKLTPELKSWMDSAEHGVVYFSLGSLLVIETLPQKTLLDIYASFAKISPIKVLMKIANATKLPPGLPSNVASSPWIPQVPVLKHKNTRVFITHGGLMGTQEALYYGVPMIGIPVFADQSKNINILVHKNIAIAMNLDDITERSMDAALDALLNDPKYRESARRASNLFRDRPLNALDTATYWIEYVIRNGPNSLRSPAMDMPWWKLHLIDVFAFLVICFALSVYLLIALLRVLLRRLQRSNGQLEKKLK